MTKYIVVTGGVISSLGKGITSASLALLLNLRGLRTTVIKMDPYINPDAGLMSPYEHGEVFVTYDGGETDLDLGNYERFLEHELSKENNITTGKVYLDVLRKERKGEYLGKTVQVIPHITDNIRERVHKIGKDFQVVIIEVGGVVGDIENIPFIEALRQIYLENKHSMIFLHLALVPYLEHIKENKTKPIQHSVRELLSKGIQPDIIVCRCRHALEFNQRKKIALFCNVSMDDVFVSYDTPNKYQVPKVLKDQKLETRIISKLGFLNYNELQFSKWNTLLHRIEKLNQRPQIRLAMIKKYTASDNYISLMEALRHAALQQNLQLKIVHINAEDSNISEQIKSVHGVLIPGGWGSRGVEGKIEAIKFARENNVPFLGICYGFQLAAIEFARNVLKLKDAMTTEIDPETKTPVIIDLNTIISIESEFSQMMKVSSRLRLGSRTLKLTPNSLASKIYQGKTETTERFRHRYTLNPTFIEQFESAGFKFSGYGPEEEAQIVDILEMPGNEFFVGVQYHPEYKTKIFSPHPLFVQLIRAMRRVLKAEETNEVKNE